MGRHGIRGDVGGAQVSKSARPGAPAKLSGAPSERFWGSPCTRLSGLELLAQVLIEEMGHGFVSFLGFGEGGVIPEGVGQGFEDDEVGLIPGVAIGTVEDGRATE